MFVPAGIGGGVGVCTYPEQRRFATAARPADLMLIARYFRRVRPHLYPRTMSLEGTLGRVAQKLNRPVE